VLQSGSWTYFLQDNKPLAYVFNHLILTSKFSLPPTTHIVRGTYATYELSNEAISVIMVAVEDTQLLEWISLVFMIFQRVSRKRFVLFLLGNILLEWCVDANGKKQHYGSHGTIGTFSLEKMVQTIYFFPLILGFSLCFLSTIFPWDIHRKVFYLHLRILSHSNMELVEVRELMFSHLELT
jgi:hypothetical protein